MCVCVSQRCWPDAMVTGLRQSVFTSMTVCVREEEERKWTAKYFSSC